MESRKEMQAFGKTGAFTLIELLVVVAIVGLIASIALPSYTQYTQQARRADATTALLRAVSQAEQYFLDNNAYPSAAEPGTTALANMEIATASASGYYSIRYAYDGGAITAQNPRFKAVALAGAAQAKDRDCRTFQAGMDGTRFVFSATGADNTPLCWP